jgi:tetratricopeptide (TPR) repeat protein
MARICSFGGLLPLAFLFLASQGFAASYDLEESQKLFREGKYDRVIEQAGTAIKARQRGEEWQLLNARALWTAGKYPEAREAIVAAHRLNYSSVRIRLLAYHILRANGWLKEADGMLDEINTLGGSRRWGYHEPLDIIALGEAAVLLGADPKLVLDNFFSPVKRNAPETREVYAGIGDLALQKHDFALASRSFQEGLQKFPEDPDLLFGLAAALEPGDRKEMIKVLERLFEVNENHPPGRLLLAEHLIDAEEYEAAEEELARVEKVNPHLPEMWAFRAVIAHLETNQDKEDESRAAALRFWKTNPVVDHIIGRKLSQKYRFTEGAARQRHALEFEASYLPAKIQLARDLLRLGHEDEGWRLADQVFKADAYDVSAYNMVTLRDTMAKFATLTNEHFILRMSEEEARIYGEQALALLNKARARLTKKYGVELDSPTTIEIFPNQKDFAVRTFGMPGGEGYLGVCFGNVVTANSPATHTMNWHSVLWHEFCHVVTLNLTRNKMPRWLSEGISVYEERRASERWGEQMNPEYRAFIVEDKMKAIADLSSAFMAPPSGVHLQFAYYQSSLVVEFLVERFGLESIRAILADLGEGQPINDALVARTAPLKELEKDFAAFAKGLAENMGADSVWEKPERPNDRVWKAAHPENFWVKREKADELVEREEFAEAAPILEELIQLYPRQSGEGCAHAMLAEIHRRDQEFEKERAVLNEWVKFDGEAIDALARLLELDALAKDSEAALRHAGMLLEINPLLAAPHRAIAQAEEERGNNEVAASAYRTLLALNPPNRSEVHFRLARILRKSESSEAKRHVLLALEEAPRYRQAHELLLEIAGGSKR